MPELYSRAIRKFERDFGGLRPNLDFSNGVRVFDVAIDIGISPMWSWKCLDNTIGAPVWHMENFSRYDSIPDEDVHDINVGDKNHDLQIVILYSMVGHLYVQDGIVRISHNGSAVSMDHEYGGTNPAHQVEFSAKITGSAIYLAVDTMEGVGCSLGFAYNILNVITV
jgi:hypothetical protein